MKKRPWLIRTFLSQGAVARKAQNLLRLLTAPRAQNGRSSCHQRDSADGQSRINLWSARRVLVVRWRWVWMVMVTEQNVPDTFSMCASTRTENQS